MGATRKTFLSNLLLLIGLNLLIKPFYILVVEAHAQERIGPDEFGLYFALLNISFVLNILPDLGITNWNNRHIAQQAAIYQQEVKQLLRMRGLLSLVYLIACVFFALYIGYEGRQVYLMFVLAVNQILATGVVFLRSYLAGMHSFRADRIVSVGDRLILIVWMLVALWHFPTSQPFPLEYLIYGQTAAYAITLVMAFAFVWRLRSNNVKHEIIPTKTVLVSSIPFAALILFSMISGRADGIILERLSGSYDAGIYAMAYRLGDMLSMISYLFAVLLLPIFSRMLSRDEPPNALFSIAFRLLFTGCCWITLLCVFVPEWILDLLYANHVTEASLVLPWTMGAAALFSLQYTTGTLLTAAGKMKPLIVLSTLALLGNIACNFVWIPSQASVGAAKAAFVTQAFVLVVQLALTQRIFCTWSSGLILRTLAFAAILCSVAFAFASWLNNSSHIFLLITASTALVGVFLNMIPLRELITAVKPSQRADKHPS